MCIGRRFPRLGRQSVLVLQVLVIAMLSLATLGKPVLFTIVDDSITPQQEELFNQLLAESVKCLLPLSETTPLPGNGIVAVATADGSFRLLYDDIDVKSIIPEGIRISFSFHEIFHEIFQGRATPSIGGWRTSALVFESVAYDPLSFQHRVETALYRNLPTLRDLTVGDIMVIVDHDRLPGDRARIGARIVQNLEARGVPYGTSLESLAECEQDVIIYIAHDAGECFGNQTQVGPVLTILKNMDLQGKLLILFVCGSAEGGWDYWFEGQQDELLANGAVGIVSFDAAIHLGVVETIIDRLLQGPRSKSILAALTRVLAETTLAGEDQESNELLHRLEIKFKLRPVKWCK